MARGYAPDRQRMSRAMSMTQGSVPKEPARVTALVLEMKDHAGRIPSEPIKPGLQEADD